LPVSSGSPISTTVGRDGSEASTTCGSRWSNGVTTTELDQCRLRLLHHQSLPGAHRHGVFEGFVDDLGGR
jgi:hypothetical protein